MTSKRYIKGNVLAGTLALILLCVVLFFVVAYLRHPYQAIGTIQNQELQQMLGSVKGTDFELAFKNLIIYYMKDGKLTFGEFNNLSDIYAAYQTAMISGTQNKFVEAINDQLILIQGREDTNASVWTGFNMGVVIFILLFAVIFGYKKVSSD